jgi:high-affinity iron transporter
MLPSFILALREGLEAALVIGMVLSILRKLGHSELNRMIWLGAGSGLLVSFIAALSLNLAGAAFEGHGEQFFEGSTLLLAAIILTWMIFWLRHQSGSMRTRIEAGVQLASQRQKRQAVFLIAFLAVVREGIELALYLLAVGMTSTPLQEFSGAMVGIGAAILLGWAVFASTRRLSIAFFFKATNTFLAFFAAGMVGLGVGEFIELGWVPALIAHTWDLSAVLPDDSTLGMVLKTLVGYTSSPALSQVIAYLLYFAVLGGIYWSQRRAALVRVHQ